VEGRSRYFRRSGVYTENAFVKFHSGVGAESRCRSLLEKHGL